MPRFARMVLVFLLLAFMIALGSTSGAQTQTQPFQLALWYPVQIQPAGAAIQGVRLNLIYGFNHSVSGLDLGLVNRTSGDNVGVQWGFVGWGDRSFTGWKDNFINLTSRMNGLATGLYNNCGDARYVMLGGFNYTESMNGLQLALVNYTQRMNGIQIGVLNIISEKKKLPVLPIVNWQFD